MRISRGVMAAAVAALLVAGCSKTGPEREPESFDNASDEAPAPIEAPPVEEQEAKPARVPEPAINTADALPPAVDPSREEQMREDADATGMTARTSSPDVVTDPSSDPIGDLVENGGVVSR